ncbi:hypothetical protein [Dactylosporangium sp. NPDC051541]|uniref:hypothetical protein n=1 Tax=Dactylosporangium sp. NPDC051541 TaxID=3363977 RepID=UPI0037B5BA34
MTEPIELVADETTPRDSQPVSADLQGEPDPEAERLLQDLLTTAGFRTGEA